jgi:hypothetical protein
MMQTPPSLDASVQRIKDAVGKFRRFKWRIVRYAWIGGIGIVS